jgi:hypothetical protein
MYIYAFKVQKYTLIECKKKAGGLILKILPKQAGR